MKVVIAVIGLILFGLSIASSTEGGSVEDLAWLAGCWTSDGGEPGSGEHWTVAAGGTLLGVSRTVKNSKTVAFEFLRIRETDGGQIEYIATPSGQTETTFLLVRLAEHEAVFENPDHDFPQRIIYRLKADGQLQGRIEGELEGQLRAVDFPMKRVDCDAQTSNQYGPASQVDLLDQIRAEFESRNPRLTEIQLVDLAASPWGKSNSYVILARAIRPDHAFEGSFEDEQFGVFTVNERFDRLTRVLGLFPTLRWADYVVKIDGFEGGSVLVSGEGATYGDQPRKWKYDLKHEN